MKRDELDHIVIEHHHQPIIDYRTFATVRALRENRSAAHYRGVKKYDNVYSGFLECGDCGSPMFAMSRAEIKDAYRCGLYHRRGVKGCTSHHIRTDTLDEILKTYLRKVKETSAAMIERLNADLAKQAEDVAETENAAANLEAVLTDLQEELKATKRQRIRDVMKHPEREAILEETYDELESDLEKRMEGIQHQIALTADKRNTIVRVNRVAKTALEVFDDILSKDKLDRNDLQLIIEKIRVYEDHVEIKLKADIDSLLRCGALPEEEAFTQEAAKRLVKTFYANVVSEGDPLEIFTEKDGEVIFKKYSPMGELGSFAAQMCESLHKTAGVAAVICDRDSVIAVSGGSRKDLMDKHISPALEQIMEDRGVYRCEETPVIPLTDSSDAPCVAVAAPIIAAGDVMGCVVFSADRGAGKCGETEQKLAQMVAGFLGRQMEE